MQDTEIWKDIPNYNGVYQVSNFGRIKSLHRNKEKILVPVINCDGYAQVFLYSGKGKPRQTRKVHQLIAIIFLNHLPCGHKLVINHRDFNKQNNRLDNLEIVTQRENANRKHIKSTSKFVGVSWDNTYKKWVASIKTFGKKRSLGLFLTEIEASDAYQSALAKHLKSIS